MLVMGLYFTVTGHFDDSGNENGGDAKLLADAFDTEDFSDDARGFAEAYIQAHGGRAALAAIESIRMHGEIRTGGETLEFTILKKRPNRIRTSYTAGATRQTYGYGAEGAWSRLTVGSETITQPADAMPDTSYGRGAFFGELLDACLRDPSLLELIVRDSWQGQPCWRVELAGTGASGLRYFVAVDSLLPLASTVRESGTGKSLTVFTDYRQVGALPLAHRVVTRAAQGETLLVIQTVTFNVGLPDSIFEPQRN